MFLKSIGSKSLLGIALLGGVLGIPTNASSASQERIRETIDNHTGVVLRGSIHPKVRSAIDRGPAEPWMSVKYMRLVLKPSAQQGAQLEQLLEEQRNPSSPDYQHWLTPEEFGERFGLNENDLAKVTSWLQAEGFTVEQTARAKNWIAFSGAAANVRLAFRTEIHRYAVDGETHFANATEPSIPAALRDVVDSIRGLDDFRPKPSKLRQALQPIHPAYTSSTGAHYLAPDDLATIYDINALYTAGFNGAGQRLVIPGQSDINLSDIATFRNTFGLSASAPQLVLYGSDPGVSGNDQAEATLDIEWSGAVARGATIVYVYSTNVFESVQYAVDQNLGTVISLSYVGCESSTPSSLRPVAQQANAQGITWMNASGDSGSAGCDSDGEASATQGPSVTFPANLPEVTGVGGAEFTESGSTGWNTGNSSSLGSATSYLPEEAWNDTPLGAGIAGGGGGVSQLFAKPWWQVGPGVPGDGARDVPDVSLTASSAHDGYMVYYGGGMYVVGGTSAASPSFAGIVSLLNQYLVSKGILARPGLGNINPTLYNLAQSATGVFHDITAGDNIVPCTIGTTGCTTGSFGYSAGTGYDLATGLGSVDAYNMVTRWSSVPASVGATMTLTANPTSIAVSGSTVLTATVAPVSGTTAPAGTVVFLTGGNWLGSVALTPPPTGTTATASVMVSGSVLLSGANTITATFEPGANFAVSSASATVTITSTAVSTTTTVTASPTSILSTATTLLTTTVKPGTGAIAPTGSVTFLAGTTTLGTATLTASGSTSSATFTAKGASLASGSNTITASYAPTGVFSKSSGTASVTVTVPVATTTTVTAYPTSIAGSSSTVLTAKVKASSGSTTPSGAVTFSLGGATLGSATLSSGAGALTVKGSSLAIGVNTITATYPATGNFLGSSVSVTVTVIPPVATTTTVAASPVSIAASSSTVLTATVKPASGTTTPTGSVTFSLGGALLGSATLSSGIGSATVKGSSLVLGSDTITIAYTPTGNFSNSSGSATVTVTPAATTTTAAASPTTIYSTASTVLTATVKIASGTGTPTGSVTFSLGSTTLGSANLSSGIGSLTVPGSSLVLGSNTISVAYNATGNFSNSSASATVTVNAPVATTTTVTASSSTLSSTSSSTTLKATVKAASGSTTPSGSVTFTLGGATLGSATLSSGVASLTVKGASLVVGSDTITATYGGATGFVSSAGSVTVTLQ